MRLLLDTHILIWLARAPDRLNTTESALVARRGTRVLISAVSIWELRLKWDRSGETRRNELLDPQAALQFAEQVGFELKALTAADCATPLEAPLAHRDPFDELLLTHAQSLGARFLTRDRLVVDHPLAGPA
ncbi:MULTISPECIES: type II toxin-antitoxin system VapC family toxin [unclassified Sphingomonas]|uniref:type II toxin-antitoxin system VapC family toxin n=1 Tax=unclassified Sphingomonas TaxID=196159 RepID=UPI000829A0AB|nr:MULTISPECIES: type II toxin-antitoxin system VapC family toxin [unclassified Sphingomonas]